MQECSRLLVEYQYLVMSCIVCPLFMIYVMSVKESFDWIYA